MCRFYTLNQILRLQPQQQKVPKQRDQHVLQPDGAQNNTVGSTRRLNKCQSPRIVNVASVFSMSSSQKLHQSRPSRLRPLCPDGYPSQSEVMWYRDPKSEMLMKAESPPTAAFLIKKLNVRHYEGGGLIKELISKILAIYFGNTWSHL